MTAINNKTLDTKSFVVIQPQNSTSEPATWTYVPGALPLETRVLTHLTRKLSGKDATKTTVKLVVPRVDAIGAVIGTTYLNVEITRDNGLPTAELTDCVDIVVGFLSDADFRTNLTNNATFF